MDIWIRAGRGIRYREHATRKHGQRPDRYWCIRYKKDGRYVAEAAGWWSAGVTQARCEEMLGEIRRNQRLGQGPLTLKELRLAGLEKLEAEAAAAESRHREDISLSEFWEREFVPRARLHLAADTLRSRGYHLRGWMKGLLDRPLRDISAADLGEVVRAMLDNGLSPVSIQHHLFTFSSIWNTAQSLGLVSGISPASKVKAPRRDSRRTRFLSEDEAELLLKALAVKDSANVYDMTLLSLYTGLRAMECFSLTWADINFDDGTIFVKDTKNGVDRHVFITAEIREMLTRRRQGQVKSAPVFASRNGGLNPYSAVSTAFHKTVEKIGLNEGLTDRRQMVVFHTLRHTFASWMVKRGHPLYVVGKLLGHKSTEMTQRYAHLAPEAQRAAVSRLEGFLNFSEVMDRLNEGKC